MLSVRLTGRRPPGRRSPARRTIIASDRPARSEEHTSELQSPCNLVCRLLLEKKKTQLRVNELLPTEIYTDTFLYMPNRFAYYCICIHEQLNVEDELLSSAALLITRRSTYIA